MSARDRSYDVITVLEGQHAEIRQAFRRAAQPGRGRGPAFRRLVRLLSIHEAAEEAHVHPAVRGVTGPAVAAARQREETEAKRLLARLQTIGPNNHGYLSALQALRRSVLAHAAREEREEFPALRRLRPLRRQMLGIEVRLARFLAPTRPHPNINAEAANKLAMPVFGPFDRCRDLLGRITARAEEHR
jgi:Hemerythrin HHE cation binding domain